MSTPQDNPSSQADHDHPGTPMARRSFLKTTGGSALFAGVAAGLPGLAEAQQAESSDFDINAAFENFMADLGFSSKDGGGTVTFTGADPIVPSRIRIATCLALPAMAAAVHAAAIFRERTGEGQDCAVDLREAMMNVNPLLGIIMQMRMKLGTIPPGDPLASRFTFQPTINDIWYQAPLARGNPFTFRTYELKDGRFATLTGAYPHLKDRALKFLKADPTPAAIAARLIQMTSEEVEEGILSPEHLVVGGIHRTAQEWQKHPQGQYLSGVPLVEILKTGDSDPEVAGEGTKRPLEGVKVLSLTHVIAGTCAARTLAEYGADVMHVARDQAFEHEALVTDVNVGMRSTFLDLRQDWGRQALDKLIPEADVFIEGFRGGAMDRLGYSVEEVMKKRPGIIYVSVRGYGYGGPWGKLPAFDMEALTVTGNTMIEGGQAKPQFDPTYQGEITDGEKVHPAFPATLVLNDYIAGYLGASGILAALRKRAKDGGSYHVRISLARAAMWYLSLGVFPDKTVYVSNPMHRMIDIEPYVGDSPYGRVKRLPPLVKLSKTPSGWRSPLVAVRGSDRPVW